MIEGIDYKEFHKPTYIDEKAAIIIACQDQNLKTYMFRKWKKEKKINLGLIGFTKFKIGLVRHITDYYWHIIVLDGIWGGESTSEDGWEQSDGYFNENENLSCFVHVKTGDYYNYDDFIKNHANLRELSKPTQKVFKKYLNGEPLFWSDLEEA